MEVAARRRADRRRQLAFEEDHFANAARLDSRHRGEKRLRVGMSGRAQHLLRRAALDVSVQAQILNLFKSLQRDLGLSYLFITHNLAVVEYLAHEVAVMYLGRIVERGTAQEVLGSPRHPYTQALLAAVPRIEAGGTREVILLEGELPSPVSPPAGCHFHPRCPKAMPECREAYPENFRLSGTRNVACWLYKPES